MTGCTVIVLPPATIASGEVRGGAPASRDFALLEPTRTVDHVDAVVLSGGSAFGLAAGDGVMAAMAEQERGFETPAGRVPIVIGLSLFDLATGDGSVRPGAAEGRAAVAAASADPFSVGLVGAGTGATCNKWSGNPEPAGLGTATITATIDQEDGSRAELIVSALIAVNAYGAIDDGTSTEDIGPPVRPAPATEAGSDSADDSGRPGGSEAQDPAGTNTTIGLVVTNAAVDKVGCHWLAQGAHDGLARSLLPAHTAADGDAVVVAATGAVIADPMHLRLLVQAVVARAIRSVGSAAT